MRQQHPINTAPQDGRTVTVLWTDFDGKNNESPARYRNLDQLKKTVATGMRATAAGGHLSTAQHKRRSSQPHGLKILRMRLKTTETS